MVTWSGEPNHESSELGRIDLTCAVCAPAGHRPRVMEVRIVPERAGRLGQSAGADGVGHPCRRTSDRPPPDYHVDRHRAGLTFHHAEERTRRDGPGRPAHPGQIVEPGTLLVALDVSVEEAELKAQEAQAALAKTILNRRRSLNQELATTQEEVDRARADLDVARAQIARTKAIIAKKTIRAPFRARVGIADVHPGQYLEEGTLLTTLQGVGEAVHVDFTVAQQIAAGLQGGEAVEVLAAGDSPVVTAKIVALDARIDPTTRNAMIRARIEGTNNVPAPGASVRVRVPVGPQRTVVAIPVSALRKGPGGDQVFVILSDKDGRNRVHTRQVESGPMFGDEIVIHTGLAAGEQIAAVGSFKLRDGVLVAVAKAAENDSKEHHEAGKP
ncbi:MAG: efflux RND transporter periplasmic adaptor subunit [Nitrospira sp.]|nr:efflux RND transporter periplasmic adaptor subunit [Nitrospira sp.]